MLRAMAKRWIISDPVSPVDAIVVLRGGIGVRPAAAAELYRLSVSQQVTVARAETDRGRHARLNREALMRHGVPPSAIAEFNYRVLGTMGSAQCHTVELKPTVSGASSFSRSIYETRRVTMDFPAPAGARKASTSPCTRSCRRGTAQTTVASSDSPDGLSARSAELRVLSSEILTKTDLTPLELGLPEDLAH